MLLRQAVEGPVSLVVPRPPSPPPPTRTILADRQLRPRHVRPAAPLRRRPKIARVLGLSIRVVVRRQHAPKRHDALDRPPSRPQDNVTRRNPMLGRMEVAALRPSRPEKEAVLEFI